MKPLSISHAMSTASDVMAEEQCDPDVVLDALVTLGQEVRDMWGAEVTFRMFVSRELAEELSWDELMEMIAQEARDWFGYSWWWMAEVKCSVAEFDHRGPGYHVDLRCGPEQMAEAVRRGWLEGGMR